MRLDQVTADEVLRKLADDESADLTPTERAAIREGRAALSTQEQRVEGVVNGALLHSALRTARKMDLAGDGEYGSPDDLEWLEDRLDPERQYVVTLRLATDPPREDTTSDLLEDLQRYGGHHPDCYWLDEDDHAAGCNCGWARTIKRYGIDCDPESPPPPLSAPPRDEPDGERRYPCMGSHETGPCAHPRHDHETDEHVYPARTDSEGREPEESPTMEEAVAWLKSRHSDAVTEYDAECWSARCARRLLREVGRTSPTEDSPLRRAAERALTALRLASERHDEDREAWRPISTAPKDGTEFVALTEEGGALTLRWEDDGTEAFVDRQGRGWAYTLTHWLPLPTPLSPEGESER